MHLPTPDDSGIHLTYCLNIHPGISWAENFAAIQRHVPRIRERVAPDRPFGLGVRLGAQAAYELAEEKRIGEFAAFLDANGLYVFTINGFPYGAFHGEPVKDAVYTPDWRTPERVEYTVRLAGILARLLPENVPGSISTVPGMYRGHTRTPEIDERAIFRNLLAAAEQIQSIGRRANRRILLALEPEPDCIWPNAAAMLGAFRRFRALAAVEGRTHLLHALGICVDACHEAVEFGAPGDALRRFREAAIPVAKVQVSSALRSRANTAAARRRFAEFADSVYLHQTRVRTPGGRILRFPDLPEALEALARLPESCEVRSHVHVPLCADRYEELESTRCTLGSDFFAALRSGATTHVELETYTFDVLPPALRSGGVVESLVREFQWFLGRWNRGRGQA